MKDNWDWNNMTVAERRTMLLSGPYPYTVEMVTEIQTKTWEQIDEFVCNSIVIRHYR